MFKKINWDFIIPFILFQLPMYVLMIISYAKSTFTYNWYVMTFIVMFGLLLNLAMKKIHKLEEQIKKIEDEIEK